MLILQLVRLDVLPQCRNDDWPEERIALDAYFEHNVFTISTHKQERGDKRSTISPGLSVDPKQPGQPLIQFELERLVVEQQQNRASHCDVSRSFHLTQ